MERAQAMNDPAEPLVIHPAPSGASQEDVELDDSELRKIDGGAFDAYIFIPPPHH
jgi:hypothetical protein